MIFRLATEPKNKKQKENQKQTTSARLHLLEYTYICAYIGTYLCMYACEKCKYVCMCLVCLSLIAATADKRTDEKRKHTESTLFTTNAVCTSYIHTYMYINMFVASFVGRRLRKLAARFFFHLTPKYVHTVKGTHTHMHIRIYAHTLTHFHIRHVHMYVHTSPNMFQNKYILFIFSIFYMYCFFYIN